MVGERLFIEFKERPRIVIFGATIYRIYRCIKIYTVVGREAIYSTQRKRPDKYLYLPLFKAKATKQQTSDEKGTRDVHEEEKEAEKMSSKSKTLLRENVVIFSDWEPMRENMTSWLRRREVCGAEMAFGMRIAIENLYIKERWIMYSARSSRRRKPKSVFGYL